MDEAIEISVEDTRNGTLLSTIYREQYYKRTYQGFPIKEAKSSFRKYVLEEDAKIIREKR